MAIYIDKPKCIGCKLCIPACPYGAIDMVEDKAVVQRELHKLRRLCLRLPHRRDRAGDGGQGRG
jgi:Fe-S-cluster-containing hydrogenase component 2